MGGLRPGITDTGVSDGKHTHTHTVLLRKKDFYLDQKWETLWNNPSVHT